MPDAWERTRRLNKDDPAHAGMDPGNDALTTAAWEDPSTEGGIPGAVYFGFDVYTNSSGKNIRLSGPERPGVALHDVTDLELSGASFLNSGLFHRAIITATAAGPDATNVKLEIIPNVNAAGSTLVAIPDKIVKGFNLLEDSFRLAAAARTGGVTVSTDLDNFTLEASGLAGGVTPPPSSSFAISSINFGAASASLTWPSAAGKSYTVERSEDLSSWTHPETVSGTGESTTHTYPLPATPPPKLFLRVRELP